MADYYFPEIDEQGNILSPDVRTKMISATLENSGLNLVPNPIPESKSGWMPPQSEMSTFSDRPDIRAIAAPSNGTTTAYLWSPSTTQSFMPGDTVRISAYVEFSIPPDTEDQTAMLRMRVHSKTNNRYILAAMAEISPTGKMQVIEQEVKLSEDFPPGPLEVSFTTNKVVPVGSIIKAAKVSVVRIPDMKTTSVVGGTIYGPGRPDIVATTEGIVTGTEMVGTTYISTDGAGVGAWVWRKRPDKKWEVTDGDTGIRGNMTELAQNGAILDGHGGGVTRLSRSGNLVTLVLAVRVLEWVGGNAFMTIPPGFQSASTIYANAGYSGDPAAQLVINPTRLNLYRSGDYYFRGTWTWYTKNPWPSTLPGTAA